MGAPGRRCLTTGVVMVVGVAVLAGCAGGPRQEFSRQDAEAIRKTLQQFVATYNKQDVAGLLEFFSATAVLLPPNSSAIRGHESIKGYYDIRFSQQGARDLEIDINDLAGHGPLAYVAASYSLRLAPPAGREGRDRGKVLWIVRNLANRWRVEYQMWSSDLPPASADP